MKAMEENINSIESLLTKATEYGKTSFDLVKLKALEKTANVVSSYIPHMLVLMVIAVFLLFSSLGLAYWIGEIIGKIFYGFIMVAAFYGVLAVVLHFFMHGWLKKKFSNYFINQILK
jgi:fatty acid desaturase